MITHSTRQRASQRRKTSRLGLRPAIEPNAIYSYQDAATVTSAAQITLRRAADTGHLRFRRIGRKVCFLGSDLLSWIEAGGKTGRSSATVEAERIKAA